jgi:hypothetical protein
MLEALSTVAWQLHLHGTPRWRTAGSAAPSPLQALERKHAALLAWLFGLDVAGMVQGWLT